MWLTFSKIDEDGNSFLVALGRALAIAQNLESNASFVLRIALLEKDYKAGRAESLDELIAFANARPKQMLGGMVRGFNQLDGMSPKNIEILRLGVLSRNYIAHEAAVGFAYDNSQRRADRVEKLSKAVRDLVQADNLVSCWSYEIQEKDFAPRLLRSAYPRDAHEWVMQPVCDWLPGDSEDQEGTRESEYP